VTGEHYSSAVHAWSCAIAPVRDPATGRVLGGVDLSRGGTIATRPAPAAVRAAAPAAEGQLAMTLVAPARVLGPDGRVPCALLGPPRRPEPEPF
jgi:transcriptional regulator of acetoin/glycerol metabolism